VVGQENSDGMTKSPNRSVHVMKDAKKLPAAIVLDELLSNPNFIQKKQIIIQLSWLF